MQYRQQSCTTSPPCPHTPVPLSVLTSSGPVCSHLPSPLLGQEELARDRRDSTVAVYSGEYSYQAYSPFAEVVPPDRVSLDTFKYMSSLVSTAV